MSAPLALAIIGLVCQLAAVAWCIRLSFGANSKLTFVILVLAMVLLTGMRAYDVHSTLAGTGPDVLHLAAAAILSGLFIAGFGLLYPSAQRLRAAQRDSLHLNALLDDASTMAGLGYWISNYGAIGYTTVSIGLAQIHGTTVDDYMRTGHDSLEDTRRWVHQDDQQRVIRRFDDWSDPQQEVDITYRIIRTDGAVRHIRDMSRFVEDRDGTLVQVGTMRDITEYKEAEERINAAMEQAEAADQAKTMFLAIMSHELRTPLNAVIGYAQMLQGATLLTSEQRQDYAATIEEAGRHLLDIISDILDAARIELGEIELREEWCDPETLAESAIRIAQVQRDGGPNNIGLTVDIKNIELRADERLVRQILVNLLWG